MLANKGHKAALMHLAKQMRDMEMAKDGGAHAGVEGSALEEASESPDDEMAEDASPMSKMAKMAEGSGAPDADDDKDPEMMRRHAFMKGLRPVKKEVSMTIIGNPMKGKMKRG